MYVREYVNKYLNICLYTHVLEKYYYWAVVLGWTSFTLLMSFMLHFDFLLKKCFSLSFLCDLYV